MASTFGGPGTTKNDDDGIVYLTLELKTLRAKQLERVEQLPEQTANIIP